MGRGRSITVLSLSLSLYLHGIWTRRANAPSTTTPAISSSSIPLPFASFASFARLSSPAPKWVRAKDAKPAKGKKAILPSPLTIQVGGRLGWRGPPGSVSPAKTEAAGGWRLSWGVGKGQSLYLVPSSFLPLTFASFARVSSPPRNGEDKRTGQVSPGTLLGEGDRGR